MFNLKSLPVVIFILLFLQSCEKNKKQNDLQIANLKGKVKSISTSFEVQFSNGYIEKKGKKISTLYNIEGYEIYNEDVGNVGGDDGEFSNSKTEIKRDVDNYKLEENTKILSGTTSFKLKSITYGYDNDNKLIKKIVSYDGATENTIDFISDEFGNIIEETLITNSGNTIKTSYKFDKNNNLIVETGVGYIINYEYNDKGDITLLKKIWEGDPLPTTRIYKYDSKGMLIKEIVNSGGAPSEISYYYDNNNNLIKINNKELGYVANYQYDAYGNWIKEIKKIYDDTYITERKIEYYSDDEDASNTQQNLRNGKYQYASERVLTSDEIANIDKYELKLIKNEIFARYGYIFKTAEMKAYFESQPWYQPKHDDVTTFLSEIEKTNIKLINESDLIENRSTNYDSDTELKHNDKSNLTYSEIRGSIISGSKQTVEKFLGQADREMTGLEYAQDIMGYKRLGVIWMERLIDYRVWIYNSPDNTGEELLVIFYCKKGCAVEKVIYSREVLDFKDIYN